MGKETLQPLVTHTVSAGPFSITDDHIEKWLDLNELMVKHPAATFFVRVAGDSMNGIGIADRDIVVVDRALEAHSGQIVIAVLDGEFILKRIEMRKNGIILHPENSKYKAITVPKDANFTIWGVVTYVIKDVSTRRL